MFQQLQKNIKQSLPQYEIFNQNYVSNLFISPQLFEMNSSPRYLILSGERINIAPKYVCLLFLSYTHGFPFFLRIFQFASWQYKQQFVPCHIYLPTFFPSQPQVKVRKKKGNFFMGSKKTEKGLCLPVFIWSQWYWLQEGLIVFHFDNTWSVQIDFCKKKKWHCITQMHIC